ncbi:phosphoribosylanthranilate isomerase [Jonesiaceae bacterium BS-20]|uniref:N-(5'-phosphoribosyl)anthranilate isomerase n=1 Tax=Jonesiaceae bacterium BS-20 TaxID=3120821 RepID=A0AAU7DWA3_9MICO
MFIKICGLSGPETLAAAVAAGADAVGFVFAPGSPRTVTAEVARELVAQVPDTVETVGVFRGQPIDEVIATARAAGVRTVQLHGGEPVADLDRLRTEKLGTIRALSVAEYLGLLEEDPEGLKRHRLLLDAPIPGAGIPFDPAPILSHPPFVGWILAGGLTPSNVAELIGQVHPTGVDVSSGVESSRGIKDALLIAQFIAAARNA